MRKFSRREVVAASAVAAVGGAVAPAEAFAQAAKPAGQTIDLECAFMTVKLPVNVEGQEALRAKTEKPGDFVNCQLRAYNGRIPGPLMVIEQGQRVTINVKNALPPYTYDDKAWSGDHNVPHHLGSTNLHVHGLDVVPHLFEPVGTSDPKAPMIEIPPGRAKQYVFNIPPNHPPGFDWYHPHHHGSTVVQAVTGMAGGIVVRGEIDEVPAIKAARDIPLVMNDIGLFLVDQPKDKDTGTPPADIGLLGSITDYAGYYTYLPKQNAIWQTFGTADSAAQVTIYDPTLTPPKDVPQPNLNGGFTTGDYALRYYLINGEAFFKETHDPNAPTSPAPTQLLPQTIKMQPGEVVRFRMLNACSDNYMPITIERHAMHLLALDGVNFPSVRTIAPTPVPSPPILAPPSDPKVLDSAGQIQLAPANRAEFLVKASMTPGTYNIVQLAQNQQFLFSAQKVIATIEVSGPPKPMALPTALPIPRREYPLIKPSEVQVMRTIFFSDQFPGSQNPYVGIDFLLNGQQYDVTDINYAVDVTGIEEWHLVVGDSQHGGTEGHPFHIHVNSFEVISVNGKMLEPGTIKDTVWIPAKSKVVIRMKFKEFIGKSVFHCHILPHEDTGMMQNFLIRRRGEPIPLALGAAPMQPQVRRLPAMDHGANHMPK